MTRLFLRTLFVVAAAVSLAACTGAPTADRDPPYLRSTATGVVRRATSGAPAASSSSTAAPVSRAVITTTPTDAATGASVLEPVVVKAANGTLDTVAVTNPEGTEVTGAAVRGPDHLDIRGAARVRPHLPDRRQRPGTPPGWPPRSSSSFTTVDPGRDHLPVIRAAPGPRTGRCRATHFGDLRQAHRRTRPPPNAP